MAEQPNATRRRWFTRLQPVVLGLGAVAAALISVLALYDRFFPTPDKHIAAITLAEVSKRVKLTEFTGRAPSVDAPMKPAALPQSTLPPAGPAVAAATKPAAGTKTVSPTSKTTPSTATVTPTTSTTARLAWPPSEAFSKSVTSQPPLDAYAVPSEMLARMLPPASLGAEGTPLPADEVAKRLSQALAKVESTPSGKKKRILWAGRSPSISRSRASTASPYCSSGPRRARRPSELDRGHRCLPPHPEDGA